MAKIRRASSAAFGGDPSSGSLSEDDDGDDAFAVEEPKKEGLLTRVKRASVTAYNDVNQTIDRVTAPVSTTISGEGTTSEMRLWIDDAAHNQ